MILGKKIGTAALLLTLPSIASASQLFNQLSISASLGYMTVNSREYVYNQATESKISQLNWENSGLAVIRGEANYPLMNLLDLNARGWINLDNSAALMNDYDWRIANQTAPSDHSYHPNTVQHQASQYDFGLRLWFFKEEHFKFGASGGYQRSLFSFNARGGCFSYSNGANTGCFADGTPVIGYQQTFASPYVGLIGSLFYQPFELTGIFQFSNLVSAKDLDQHYLRTLTFYDNGRNFEYYSGMITLGYYIKPQIKLFAEGAYTYYSNDHADTGMYNYSTGEYQYFSRGSAGLSSKNYAIALGIQYMIDGGSK